MSVFLSRYFINEETLKAHFKTKVHKKRLKNLQEKPYGGLSPSPLPLLILVATTGPQEDGQEKVDNGPRLRLDH